MKLGILGGTFDPIHQGHLLIADHAQKQFHLNKVFFVPAFLPPHKSSQILTPAPHRYRMVELALMNHPFFEASDLEMNRPEVSYTVDTLHYFHRLYPQAELFLILGSDSVNAMGGWHQPETILKMAKILAAARKGSEKDSNLNVNWIEMSECPIASSDIREKIRQGKSVSAVQLAPLVEAYIRTHHLYTK